MGVAERRYLSQTSMAQLKRTEAASMLAENGEGQPAGSSPSLGDLPATVLPELDIEKLRRWCRKRCPESLADQVRLEVMVKGKRVSVHENRPPWHGGPGEWTSMPIAQIRYTGDGKWTLYFGDRYGGWTLYFDLEPEQPIDVIIEELEEDPTCVFWG